MGNTASQTFYRTATWTAPAGVTSVTVTAQKTLLHAGGVGGTAQTMWFLDSFGNIYTSGSANQGQLGNNTSTAVSSPVQVVGGLNFSNGVILCNHVSTSSTLFGITNQGRLYGWGQNSDYGQIGDGTQVNKSSPVLVLDGLTFAEIHGGGQEIISALSPNGTMYSWGQNNSGNLGTNQDPSTVLAVSSPTAVVGGLRFGSFTIAGAGQQIFAITTAGAMYAWGRNTNGILGTNQNPGTTVAISSPVAVVGGLTFSQLCATQNGTNSRNMGGLTNTDAAYMWGLNTVGQLGDGTTTDRSSPVAVVGGLTFKQLLVANTAVFGLTVSGKAYGWGGNGVGQLGDGTTTNRSSPVQVLGGLTFSKLFCNNDNTANVYVYGLTTSGSLYTWGGNTNGELGLGDVNSRSSPVQVLGGLTFTNLSAVQNQNNGASVFGVTSTNQIYAWGWNAQGQLGLGDQNPRSSPVAVLGSFTAMPPQITQTVIPVVPNTSYTVTMGQYLATFGTVTVGQNNPELITLTFEQ